jgi:hypothetical protein
VNHTGRQTADDMGIAGFIDYLRHIAPLVPSRRFLLEDAYREGFADRHLERVTEQIAAYIAGEQHPRWTWPMAKPEEDR